VGRMLVKILVKMGKPVNTTLSGFHEEGFKLPIFFGTARFCGIL
jgi:hypothetical protein